MEFTDTIIELNFDRNHFEEIYFKDGRGSIPFDPLVKLSFIYLLLTLLLFTSSIVYSYITDKAAWLIVVFFLFLLYALTNFYLKFSAIAKWRREVSGYLNSISKVKQHKLILSPNSLSMLEDGVETIVKWSAFSKLVIEQNHLSLWGSENFIFPKKSMSKDEYNLLTEIARSQIKNGL
jgi:hypothetical protein